MPIEAKKNDCCRSGPPTLEVCDQCGWGKVGTDVNDLLRNCLERAEKEHPWLAHTVSFREAHDHLASLETTPHDCPPEDHTTAGRVAALQAISIRDGKRLDSLEAKQERTEKVLRGLLAWLSRPGRLPSDTAYFDVLLRDLDTPVGGQQ